VPETWATLTVATVPTNAGDEEAAATGGVDVAVTGVLVGAVVGGDVVGGAVVGGVGARV
jgi:hypothetical protein